MSSNKYMITMSLMKKLHKTNVPMFVKQAEKSLVPFKPAVVVHDVEFVVKNDTCVRAVNGRCSVMKKECNLQKNIGFYQRVYGSQVHYTNILLIDRCANDMKKNKSD